MSASGPTRTSTTARVQPCDWFPTRRISPFRRYQSVPPTSRTRVTRRPTASTVPETVPKSTRSPIPYWSSKSMKMPESTSLTRDCAPKARAMPTTPTEVRSGPMSQPSSFMTSRATIEPTITLMADPSTEFSVSARCSRRSTRPAPSETFAVRAATWPNRTSGSDALMTRRVSR